MFASASREPKGRSISEMRSARSQTETTAEDPGGVIVSAYRDTDPSARFREGRSSTSPTSAWLGITWDDGPIRQSGGAERHAEAASGRATTAARAGSGRSIRLAGTTLAAPEDGQLPARNGRRRPSLDLGSPTSSGVRHSRPKRGVQQQRIARALGGEMARRCSLGCP